MINENFVFLGSALSFIGAYIYIRGIFEGKVRPNIVTWLLWATAPMIAFAAQIVEGAGLRSVLTFTVGFGPLLIVIAAFIKKRSMVKLRRSDYLFGVLSVIGIILWLITGEGALAITFAILADLFAAFPTIRKLYREPETENGNIFGFGIIGGAITLLTVDAWLYEQYSFALYILLINMFMFYPSALKGLRGIMNRNGINV